MTAPVPAFDAIELPTRFVAVTLATTLAPFSRLKGASWREEMGIRQVIAVPVQYTSGADQVPSLFSTET